MEYTIGTVVFEDWVITRKIGEGATGVVFEIVKKNFDPPIKSALKVIRIPKSETDVVSVMSEGMDKKSVTGYFRGIVDDVLREIKVMVALKAHPNIVSYEDHCVLPHSNGVGWDILIKMELLTPLSEWILQHPMNERETLRLGCEISSALAYAKRHNICHRDVKPENIFVDTEFKRFKLGDFGIARTIEKTTGNLSKKGTENYMAPEVYWGKGNYDQVDIYSLGIVLYRFLNQNRLPFYPDATKSISFSDRENAINKRMHGTTIPDPVNGSQKFVSILRKSYAYKPGERYESMDEFHDALKKLYESCNDKTVKLEEYNREKYDHTIIRPQPKLVEEKRKLKIPVKKILVLAVLLSGIEIGVAIGNISKSETENNNETESTGETLDSTADTEEAIAVTEMTTEKNSDVIVIETENAEVDLMDQDQNVGKGDWYYITSSYTPGIAMRREPSDNSDLLCRLPYGTEFYVDTFSGAWGYTTVYNMSGWIEMKYAESTRNRSQISANEENRNGTDNNTDSWYYISSRYEKGIAVRSEPTGESELLTRLPYGTEFQVESIYGDWGYTTVNGVTGWIELSYADKIEK